LKSLKEKVHDEEISRPSVITPSLWRRLSAAKILKAVVVHFNYSFWLKHKQCVTSNICCCSWQQLQL